MKLSVKNMLAFLLAFLFPLISLADASPSDLWTIQKIDSQPVLQADGKSQLVSKILTQNNQDLNYLIAIRYPQITGNQQLSDGAKHFNQLVQSFVDKQASAFKQDMTANATNSALPKANSYLKINYEMAGLVSQSQNTNYTSIRFSIDSFERGMAHPSHQTQVFNFDVAQNKLLALADLFNPNAHYLAFIANYCTQQLQAKKLPGDMVKTGAVPTFDNYKNWNITLSGLLITFDEAQVAPRYFGAQQVLIPRDALKDMVNHQTACTIGILLCDKT